MRPIKTLASWPAYAVYSFSALTSFAGSAHSQELGCAINSIDAAYGTDYGFGPSSGGWAFIDGDPIKYAVGPQGGVAAWVCQPNGLKNQYYGETSWETNLWLNDEQYISNPYGANGFQPVSLTQVDAGTIEAVFQVGDVELRQIISYAEGELYVKKRWELTNTGSETIVDLRLFHGGDSYFGGVDSARSWWDPDLGMIYVNNSNFSASGVMGFYASPATPADHYYGGGYYDGYMQARSAGQLSDAADSSFIDAGYQLQWNRAALEAGATWVIEAYETWTQPSAVQMIAPADINTPAGNTLVQEFKLHNLDAENSHTVSLTAVNSLGWIVSFPNGAGVEVAPLERVSIPVRVEVPAGASPGAAGVTSISTTVEGGTMRENAASARISVIEVNYSITPESLDFGRIALGETATRTLTIANLGSPLSISKIGNSDGLAAPFAFEAGGDTCSDSVVAFGESCTLAVTMSPVEGGESADSFNIPVLSPATASHPVQLSGAGYDPALEPPAGHTVAFTRETFSAESSASAGFSFSAALIGAGYTYAITSSGGGTPVTGSGTIVAADQLIEGLDLQGLADGTLTLSAVLANEAGVEADPVMHSALLDVHAPSGHAASFGAPSFNFAEGASFHLSDAEIGTDYSYTIASSGGGTPVTGSGSIGRADQGLSGIDVSALAGGTLTLSIVLIDAAGNAAQPVTTTSHLDATPPGPLDSDGDGMLDDYEVANGFDPSDPSDAAADADGDAVSNLEESVAGTDPFADDYPPVLEAPALLEVDAVGLLTPIPSLAVPTAVDGLDGEVRAVFEDDVSYLPPGAHSVTWIAADAAGNQIVAEQWIHVHPQISLGRDQVQPEGSAATVSFHLNGPAPVYPIEVAYEIGGTATLGADHDLYAGTVVFEAGALESGVPVQLPADAIREGSEVLEVRLVGEGNFGARSTHVLTIVEGNVSPKVTVDVLQGERSARLLSMDGGSVQFAVNVEDANPQDLHGVEWWFPAAAAVTNAGDAFRVLDPSSLAPGVYEMRAVVRDNGTPALETEVIESFRIVESVPELLFGVDSDGDGFSDTQEGYGDADGDGVPDYLDSIDQRNVLSERSEDQGRFLIEADPGVRPVLGESAQLLGGAGASMTPEEATEVGIPADEIANIGGYFDFVVRDVPTAGASISIVIPQRQVIPQTAVYRKFDGIWFTFVEDERNRLASAPGQRGICPPPGSDAFQPGLTPGDWCVELTIEDGGPNDTDGLANGAIRDPGGVGTVGGKAYTTTGGGGSGGSGAFGAYGVLGLLAIFGLRRMGQRRAVRRPSRFRMSQRNRGRLRPVARGIKVGAGLAVFALAFALPKGHAEEIRRFNPEALFVTAHLGFADTRVSRSDLEGDFARAGIDAGVTDVDAERSAFQLGFGYALSERWSMEAGYVDLGEVKVEFNAPQLSADLAQVHPASGDGYSLSGAYRYPVGPRSALIARAGVLEWDAAYSTENLETRVDRAKPGGRDWVTGIGAEFAIAPGFCLSAEIRHFDLPRKATHVLGVGIRWEVGRSGRD